MNLRNQNLTLIREACVKSNPEITELKFGCEVDVGSKYHDDIERKFYFGCFMGGELKGYARVFTIQNNGKTHDASGMWKKGFGLVLQSDEYTPIGQIKSLGRPIRLADVLLAIQKKKGDGFIMSELFAVGHPARYNLRADNLESQSDETLQFIANVLV